MFEQTGCFLSPPTDDDIVFRNLLKVLAADALLLVALYYVVLDLDWRTSYAASLHTACPNLCGYTPSFSYSFLTRLFTMAGNPALRSSASVRLTSPPTLNWVQVLSVILVAVNAWFVYVALWKGRRSTGMSRPSESVPPSPPA